MLQPPDGAGYAGDGPAKRSGAGRSGPAGSVRVSMPIFHKYLNKKNFFHGK